MSKSRRQTQTYAWQLIEQAARCRFGNWFNYWCLSGSFARNTSVSITSHRLLVASLVWLMRNSYANRLHNLCMVLNEIALNTLHRHRIDRLITSIKTHALIKSMQIANELYDWAISHINVFHTVTKCLFFCPHLRTCFHKLKNKRKWFHSRMISTLLNQSTNLISLTIKTIKYLSVSEIFVWNLRQSPPSNWKSFI